MQRILFCCTLLLLLTGCNKDSINGVETTLPTNEWNLSHEQVAEYVKAQLEATQEPFDWLSAPDEILWGALKHGENYAAIGYQPEGFQNFDEKVHLIDITDEEWTTVRNGLIDFIVSETNRHFPGENYTADDLILDGLEEDNIIPDFGAKILHAKIMQAVLNHPDVRYLEPDDFIINKVEFRGSGGCNPEASPVANGILIEDAYCCGQVAKVPYMFADHQITEAWSQAGAYGNGIGIGIIDVGVSDEQAYLNQYWRHGLSGNGHRGNLIAYVNANIGTSPYPSSDCTHGTEMIGLAAGPRANGALVGAAFQSRVYSHRAANDVVINGRGPTQAVKSAFVTFGSKSSRDLRIISMSMGRGSVSRRIRDGVNYAHNQGKLIFCAAGTTRWSIAQIGGVVFPAQMDNVQAVTGVKESGTRCTTCHVGAKVDFTATVQSSSEAYITSPVYPWSGMSPINKTLGSSPATAMTAGMAAQIWSKYPNETRKQILERMKETAQFPQGDINNEFGHGRVQVLDAINYNH